MTDLDADDLLVRQARLVPLHGRRAGEPVDLRVTGGRITEVGPSLITQGEAEIQAGGRWAIPGLWDAHVHLQQWSRSLQRLDLSGTHGPEDVTRRVAAHLTATGREDVGLVVGYGHRSATWARQPTVAELDAVSGTRPVVLISGDAHHGWLNSAGLALLGLPPRVGTVDEAPWFEVLPQVQALEQPAEDALRQAVRDAAARGVVGVVDMEWEDGPHLWPQRIAAGIDLLRVRPAVYESGLDTVLAEHWRTGDPLPGGRGLATMGPFKVIFDGSLNTRTAYCCTPYAGPDGVPWHGLLNLTPQELDAVVARAAAGGLESAVHAIGDAAVTAALDALQQARARGSVEHVQLVARADLPRFRALGIRASVQPAHLLDDRSVTMSVWPDAQDRCFALRSLRDAGAELALGSDAPVARLDPWSTMAAAVHRGEHNHAPWTAHEALTPAQALAASTDGQQLRPGDRGDLVLLDDNPLAHEQMTTGAARRLRHVRVAVTVVGGRTTHRGI